MSRTHIRWLRNWASTVVVLVLLGAPAGLLWAAVAPRARYVIDAGSPLLGDPESQALIAADGWFAVITAAAGLVCGIGAYAAGRLGDVPLLLGLAVGGVVAAFCAWRVGHLVGLDAFTVQARTALDGTTVTGALDLRAKGVLVIWPWVAVATYGLLEALDVAGRTRLEARDGADARLGEPDQIDGGKLDLKAAPPSGDVDRRET